jgi:hypothetical protein
MQGKIVVTYSIICDNDTYQEVSLQEIVKNEKVNKVIKSEFAKGIRGIEISTKDDATILISTQKELFTFEAQKRDFADLIELAEEDAKKNKHFKKGCQAVTIVNFVTVEE